MLRKQRLQILALLPLLAGMLCTFLLAINMFDKEIDKRLLGARETLEKHIRSELQARIDTAYNFATACEANGFSELQCRNMMKNVRFGDQNYMWIHKLTPKTVERAVLLVHPNKDILGQDLSGYIDTDWVNKLYYKGKIHDKRQLEQTHIKPTEIFKKFNQIALNQGSGFIQYYWPKVALGESTEVGYPKTSFIKYFEPFHWVIGAGEYADIIDNRIDLEKESLLESRNKFLLVFFIVFLLTVMVLVFLTTLFSKKISDYFRAYEKRLLVSAQQLRESENRLFDIASSSGDIIWEVNTDFVYTFVSGQTLPLLGLPANQLIGMKVFNNIPQEESEFFKTKITQLRDARQPIIDVEQKFTTCSGEEIYLQLNGLPVFNRKNEFIGYRGVFRDITEKKIAAAQKQQLEFELQQAHRMEAVGTLAAGIAHEINTPLQFIGDNVRFCEEASQDIFAFANALQDNLKKSSMLSPDEFDRQVKQHDLNYLQQELPKALSESLGGIEQIRHIVAAMKNFSHQGGQEKELININDALENTLTLCRNEWKYCADIVTQYNPDLPLLSCYSAEIKQVFLNLIVNAADAVKERLGESPSRKGTITITTYQKQGSIHIEIEDTGIGIPDTIRERVFDHFFTTKEVGKGSGQGLSIAYKTIQDRHEGKIYFRTQEGRGTTFYISIPVTCPPNYNEA